ncbi:hypothetical protein WN944_027615 [Citrus x changshan-huyou]|uniref:Histidine-containing phosphotransfer protein n=2 Tax=Citrus TaxID=2706 RepID=A0AAP0Q9C3_9ROSI
MALPMQRSLLRSFVQSMHEEGIVNDDFYQLLAMKETVRPDYVVRAVTSYCLSAQNLFSHLTYHICQPEVDYHQVNTAACEFYARTSSHVLIMHNMFPAWYSIGAEHVKLSCAELIQACQENDKE